MANNEASDSIEAAIQKAMQSTEDYEEGDILLDWVVIAYVSNPDTNKRASYPLFVPNGSMPTYRLRGLLHTALMLINRGQRK